MGLSQSTCGSIVQGSVAWAGPFLMYKHGEGTAQITTQGHRDTFFRVVTVQIAGDRGTQLLRAAAPMSKSLGP